MLAFNWRHSNHVQMNPFLMSMYFTTRIIIISIGVLQINSILLELRGKSRQPNSSSPTTHNIQFNKILNISLPTSKKFRCLRMIIVMYNAWDNFIEYQKLRDDVLLSTRVFSEHPSTKARFECIEHDANYWTLRNTKFIELSEQKVFLFVSKRLRSRAI